MDKLRIDQLLVDQKYASNRSKAKDLIRDGLVKYNNKLVTKAGQVVNHTGDLQVEQKQQFVSRGGKKLATAIEAFNINPQDLIIADVGASTGGFTDYLLKKGAKKVYAIDVGHGQLASKLLQDPRVENLEGQDIRTLENLPELVDLAVADLSYISLKLTLIPIANLLKPHHQLIVLYKPQFEVGRENLRRDGVVKDPVVAKEYLQEFIQWVADQGFTVQKKIPSGIKGKTGNQEYLLLITT